MNKVTVVITTVLLGLSNYTLAGPYFTDFDCGPINEGNVLIIPSDNNDSQSQHIRKSTNNNCFYYARKEGSTDAKPKKSGITFGIDSAELQRIKMQNNSFYTSQGSTSTKGYTPQRGTRRSPSSSSFSSSSSYESSYDNGWNNNWNNNNNNWNNNWHHNNNNNWHNNRPEKPKKASATMVPVSNRK